MQFFNKSFDEIPYGIDVKELDILPYDIADYKLTPSEFPIVLTVDMIILDEGDLPEKQITYINNQDIANKDILKLEAGYPERGYWDLLEKYLCEDCLPSWQKHSLKVIDNELVVS